MGDDEILFNTPQPDPQPSPDHQPGAILWTLRRGPRQRQAQLRSRDSWGVEFQLFADGQLLYGRLCASQAIAEMFAARERSMLEREGWAVE